MSTFKKNRMENVVGMIPVIDVYLSGIEEPCICNTFCRNLNLYSQIQYVYHVQNLFLSLAFDRSRALDFLSCVCVG